MVATPSTLTALAERLELWPIDRLRPYERNPRTHSADQVAQIAASMVEFGFTNPILVDEADGILAGHGRLMAARELGLAEVPVVRLGHLTPAQKRAYVIADNQLTLNSGWNETFLAEELAWLRDERFDLDLLGFDAGELEALLAPADGEPDAAEDEAPEPPVEPVSKPGDLWLLGDHRLLCGDATVLSDVERVLAGSLADMAWTDPPYNVDLRQLGEGQAAGQGPPHPQRRAWRRLRGLPAGRLHQPRHRDQGCGLHRHEQLGAAHAAGGVHGGRRQVVDLHHLGQEHLHPRPGRLPAAVRADPLRLAAGHRALLVRGARPG
jgi:hypothetical protein